MGLDTGLGWEHKILRKWGVVMSSKSPTNQALTGCVLLAIGLVLVAVAIFGVVIAFLIFGGG
jgi:hypothetical protein